MRTQLALLLSMLFLCSCKNSVHDFVQQCNGEKDSFLSKIPLNAAKLPVQSVKYVNEMCGTMGLNKMNAGFSALMIRIWYGYAFSRTNHVFTLSNTNGKWSAKKYIVSFPDKKNGLNIIDTTFTMQSLAPKSSWDATLHNLQLMGIIDLPDFDQVFKNASGIHDGNGIVVEVATHNFYRLYTYVSPESFREESIESEKMTAILDLIDSEFDLGRVK